MHLVLVGPGALGSLFAVRLAPDLQKEGNALFLLDHDAERAEHLAREGFVLQESDRTLSSRPKIVVDPGEIPLCDILLLCVKAGDVGKALLHAAPLVRHNTLVIGLQNGMAHLADLESSTGVAVAAVCSEGATLQAPGRVIHGGSGLTRFGLLNTTIAVPSALEALVDLFTGAKLAAELVHDIRNHLWEKLVINVGINALTAIHEWKNGRLLTSSAAQTTMKNAIAEAVAIAGAMNILIRTDPLALALSVCRKTQNNISSMLQDVLKKRPTEIDAINGYIVRQGRELGIPTPVNAHLVQQIRSIEQSWQAIS